ncbi:cytochrome b [Paracoccus laeviglucosivorans]|uniref:Cytochrome b561 n=1 Tax=Paracoccus laeviglucosivorans TaxID=1197861 RepID=A0A521EC94_9RHOB|nr:cytochrome b/b6 domain-containing protein [Paracoccus laeviglucosivorans]SMO81537.1 cytochrome b561 [Paracoccus laeviglucosivorans]
MGQTSWGDTPARYGRVSRVFHWLGAGLLIWQFAVIGAYRLIGQSPLLDKIAGLGPSHGVVGLYVLALVIARAIWRWRNRQARPRHQGLLGRAARIGHLAFYALMFAIPALALLRAYGNGKGWNHWGIQIVPATGHETGWMVQAANALHGELAWLLLALIAGHVLMVVVHHLWLREPLLSRMAGRLK